MSANCLFCKIVDGKIPARKIFEDDEVIAFHDINPAAPVHFLIIPKLHIATLAECETMHHHLLGKMLGLAPQLAREQGCGYVPEPDGHEGRGSGGFKTFINTGPGGGQEVYHLHIHVLGGARPWQPR
jgi:histidine triad (HIT) family protein